MSNTHTVLLVLVKEGLNDPSFEKVCYGIWQSSDSAKMHSDISTTIFTILAHSLSRGYVKRNLEKQAKDMNTFWNRLKMPPTLGYTGSVDSEIQKPMSQTRKISGARQETQGAKESNLPVWWGLCRVGGRPCLTALPFKSLLTPRGQQTHLWADFSSHPMSLRPLLLMGYFAKKFNSSKGSLREGWGEELFVCRTIPPSNSRMLYSDCSDLSQPLASFGST